MANQQEARRLFGSVQKRAQLSPQSVVKRKVSLHIVSADATPESEDLADVFDRQVRAFGRQGQRILKSLRVGVVGAGGTGSAVIEQLTRIGVGTLVIADDDTVTPTNITRIYGSFIADVGLPKIEVARRDVDAIGLGTRTVCVYRKITEREGLEAFRTCDVVFGCTDDNAGRTILSRLAYWYCLPVIDMGVVIRAPEGRITHLDGRVTYMAPGLPCLHCRDRIDLARARDEGLPPDERERRAAEGYAIGLDERDPAVVAYTSAVAAMAVAELLQRLFGFGSSSLAGESLVRFDRHEWKGLAGAGRSGHHCVSQAYWGRGDRDPLLDIAWAS